MKHIAIASLCCGTAIILAPIAHSIISLGILAHLLALNASGHVDLSSTLNDSYQSWCLFIGCCLLVTGTTLGFRARTVPDERPTVGQGARTMAEAARA